jgi:hypothetical protein
MTRMGLATILQAGSPRFLEVPKGGRRPPRSPFRVPKPLMAWQTRAGAPLAGSLGSSKIVSFGLLGDTEEAMRAPTSMALSCRWRSHPQHQNRTSITMGLRVAITLKCWRCNRRAAAINPAGNVLALRDGAVVVTAICRLSRGLLSRNRPRPGARRSRAKRLSAAAQGQHPSVSAGHVKKPDLLCIRPVEHMDRLGGGLQ